MSKTDMRELEDVAQKLKQLCAHFDVFDPNQAYVATQLRSLAEKLGVLAGPWKKDLERAGDY